MKKILRNGFLRVEAVLDRVFGPAWNPMTQLGALGYFFYWIVAVSGIYLYIAFDTSVTGVYESVEYLTHEQWYLGGILRSFHRYASDAMVLFMFVHMAREFALDRYRGARAFSWITGIPVIILVYAAGISGYWLVWDELAQFIAIATIEWMDWLPIFGETIARNFLTPDAMDDRFFSLLIFMHIFLPLLLLFLLWLHILRITKPKINPPKGLAAGFLLMFFLLSIFVPATSHGPADLSVMTSELNLDWYYLGFYPLFDFVPAGLIWAGAAFCTILLCGAPYIGSYKRPEPAIVDLDNCNGCERCADDCPYSAITMVPRTDGKPFDRQAEVNTSLCVSCGICAGACPTSTPFRRRSDLVPGIDIPGLTIANLREQVDQRALEPGADPRILVFGCTHAASLAPDVGPSVQKISVPCVAMVPPAFIDYALSKNLADGVVMLGCREGECYNRSGGEWTKARLNRERDPFLRNRVPREKILFVEASPTDEKILNGELSNFDKSLRAPKGESE
jgi:ferredoxin/coenzyme F420-reducing hydrogenase delta subunit